MSLFRNLFGRRSSGFNPFTRFSRRSQGFPHNVDRRRGGMALGGLAALAAPFIMRKLMARRAARNAY